jgi:hypothetical protein
MKLCPLSELGSLTEEECETAECSNRVYVPARQFTEWLGTSVVTLRIQNVVEQSVIGTLFAAHMNHANTVYAPSWMCAALDCDLETCEVAPVEVPPCRAITLQPFNEGDVEEMEYLQAALERYSVVSPNQELLLWHPYGYPFAVRVAVADGFDGSSAAVNIVNCEIPLQMLPPIVSNTVAATTATTATAATEATAATPPSAATAATTTKTETTETVTTVADLRRRCYEAALRRMEAKEKPE